VSGTLPDDTLGPGVILPLVRAQILHSDQALDTILLRLCE
jgi:hypothetical protein